MLPAYFPYVIQTSAYVIMPFCQLMSLAFTNTFLTARMCMKFGMEIMPLRTSSHV